MWTNVLFLTWRSFNLAEILRHKSYREPYLSKLCNSFAQHSAGISSSVSEVVGFFFSTVRRFALVYSVFLARRSVVIGAWVFLVSFAAARTEVTQRSSSPCTRGLLEDHVFECWACLRFPLHEFSSRLPFFPLRFGGAGNILLGVTQRWVSIPSRAGGYNAVMWPFVEDITSRCTIHWWTISLFSKQS